MALAVKSFEDKVALVTGGSSGIGLALAKGRAAQGAQVWILARRKEALAATQKEIGAACRTVVADVSDWQQVQKAVGQVIREAGIPDIVINSAGVTRPGYVQELDVEVFRQMMAINYMGTVHVVKAALPGMMERGSGHIINISSVAGFLGAFGYSAYGASKYAVRGFSDVLRGELRPHGIRVSVVFPPDTDTPQLAEEKQFQPPETKLINALAKMLSADVVAEIILRDVRRKKYLILPGEAKFWYHLSRLLGNGWYLLADWLVRDARRKAGIK